MSGALVDASREWRNGLIEVGGNNRLLYYRNTTGTLVLDECPVPALGRLLAGESVRLSELFPAAPALARAQKACTFLARKQREAVEEYGISVTSLATGLASWDPEGNPDLGAAFEEEAGEPIDSGTTRGAVGRPKPRYTRPRAPVLLRSIEIESRRGAQEVWYLRLVDDYQLNGVLMHVLNADQQRITDEVLGSGDDVELDVETVADRITARCADVAEFVIDRTLVVGAFSYMKQPMVEDTSDVAALGGSDLVAALAGDAAAAGRVRAIRDEVTEATPDYQPVEAEFLILDADASQSYVVNAALAGRNLVVEGPPGTGKSQTIANIIAAAVAADRTVLFVAQKRAAVAAVLDRLQNVDLSHLVLDVFAASSSRRFVADQLQHALDRQANAGQARTDELHHVLGTSRDRLVRHAKAMHDPRHGWGISVSELLAQEKALPAEVTSDLRVPVNILSNWSELAPTRHRAALTELTRLGAFDPGWAVQTGWSPRRVTTPDALRESNDALGVASRDLSPVLQTTTAALQSIGLPRLKTLREGDALAGLFRDIERVTAAIPDAFDSTISAADLQAARAAVDRGFRKASGIKLTWAQRRAAKGIAKRLAGHLAAEDRSSALETARNVRSWWNVEGPPRVPEQWRDAWTALDALRDVLRRVDAYTVDAPLEGVPVEDVPRRFRELAGDQRRGVMPRVAELRAEVLAGGLEPVLEELTRRPDVAASTPERAAVVFDRVVVTSLLDDALLFDADLATLKGADLDAATKQFQRADLGHLEANAVRIRRLVAERLKRVLDDNPEQHLKLKREVTKKTRFTPVRRLLHDLSAVMLAAKPVWAMSPLQVSRLLPREQLFDLVIFDEASQVKPADAIPALLRGRQLVVAGDSRQLPPTEFFSKTLDGEIDEPDEDATFEQTADEAAAPRSLGSFTQDAESILFAVDRLLAGQSRRLLWHYRSRDERLIATSNRFVYDGSLTTFPSADTPNAIEHIEVPYSPGIGGGTNSPEAEVAAVVKAVKAHAGSHPDESLGVIAFGVKHQNRLEAALADAFRADPGLEERLNAKEPFFVKSIERVQGDERDAILLTVGYGKSADGALRLFWGPLLQAGGERRLNVAISRARLRMTLITSFGAHDLAEDGHDSFGYRLMYQFVRFVASRGAALGDGPNRGIPLNPFEIDIRDRLEHAGLRLDTQVGVGSYRIDFAARHPDKPGRHVLAIEADGAAYHSGHVARERDRLRQQLLERRGWTFHRIWSTDWFNDPDREIERVMRAYQNALARDTAPQSRGSVADVPAAWELPVGRRRHPAPAFRPGLPIDDYPQNTLRQIVAWVRSDDVVRSADDELAMVMKELGFARRGSKIVSRIRTAQVSLTG